MMGVRVKAIGLGLALTAGAALAGGPEWRAAGAPAPNTPGVLPASVQPAAAGPVWVPARPPARVVPAGGTGDPLPPLPVPADPDQPVGPRAGGDLGPLPAIPPLPTPEPPLAAAPPAAQPEPPKKPSSDAPPVPPVPPPVMPVPQPPVFPAEPRPLPPPRPAEGPPPQPPTDRPELEPAPAELRHAAGLYHGAPAHGHGPGTFGSPPLRISRDYPPLRELVGHGGDRPGFDADPSAGLYSRFFARGEYLLWWLPGYAIPVLGTTNANTARNGFFGEPGTRSVVGPGPFLDSMRGGFRLRAGAWLNEDKSFGVDAGFFFLGERDRTQVFRPSQFPLITRPIFSPNTDAAGRPIGETGEAVAVPGILDGTLTVQGTSQFGGADVNARWCWINGTCSRSEVFAGYRYLNLRESLTVTENITVVGPGGGRLLITDPIGTRIVVQDRFATRNQFHGGQIGGSYERRFGRWSVDARASVALGVNNQTLEISGFQDRRRPGMADPMLFRGGLIATGPNLGRFERNEFSVVPELTLNAGYWLTPGVRVFGGYNFLLWTNVIRPGDQIDRVVDFTLLPNTPPVPFSGQFRPQPTFKQTDLVVNGIQFGVELRW